MRRRGPSLFVYRLLLRAYPAEFRRAYGDDMAQLFADRLQYETRSRGEALALWLRALADGLGQALLEHLLRWRQWRSTGDRRAPCHRPPPRRRHRRPGEHLEETVSAIHTDFAYAVRTLGRSPLFTTIAVLTLALGIGANTAIFNVTSGVLLMPLRYGDPERLVAVWESSPSEGIETSETSSALFVDWREQSDSFSDLTAFMWDTFVLQERDESVALDGLFVHPNFFSVLELDPLFGRRFTADDAAPGQRGDVILISHRLWRERFGADAGIVGRQLRLDGRPVVVIGVLRPDVAAPDADADLLIPAAFVRPPSRWTRHQRRLTVLGRLADSVTVEQAQEEMSRLASLMEQGEFADIYEGWDVRVVPLHRQVVGEAEGTLAVALAAVGLVLLIACVNVANMLLARSLVRRREMAVRLALGAGGGRIVRLLLIESVLLAIAGGIVGVGLARITHDLILAFQPDVIPRAEELEIGGLALAFAFTASLITGLLFGLAPAWQSLRVEVGRALQEGARGGIGGRASQRLRNGLVMLQLALATALLCAAGLMLRTLFELRSVDPGFDPERTLAARVFLDSARYRDGADVGRYFETVAERLAAVPGVTRVGASSALPMDPMGINYDLPYRLEGQEQLASNQLPAADFRVVTPGYFEALGTPLLAGRLFNRHDRPDTTFVALVNQTMAREVWPDQDPIGQRFYTPSTDWHWFEVVGVVGDTRYYGLDSSPRREMYVAHAQVPRGNMTFVVRGDGEPAALSASVRREVLAVDPAQPSHSILPLEQLLADDVAVERFYALVLGIFATVALLLAAAGIYGVLSYTVTQRTQEIGLRMALGASAPKVLAFIVGHGMLLAATGVAAGLAVGLATSRVLASTLFGISAADPLTFAAVSILLILIALLACSLPALRASRVDPVTALRDE